MNPEIRSIDDMTLEESGEYVQSIRKYSGFEKQKDFCHAYGFTLESLKSWENGQRKPNRGTRSYLQLIFNDPENIYLMCQSAKNMMNINEKYEKNLKNIR